MIYTFIGIFVIIDNFLKSDLLKGGHSMNVAKKYFWPQHQAKGGQRAAWDVKTWYVTQQWETPAPIKSICP